MAGEGLVIDDESNRRTEFVDGAVLTESGNGKVTSRGGGKTLITEHRMTVLNELVQVVL